MTGRHDGYFTIVDNIQESLTDRIDTWRSRRNRSRLRCGWIPGSQKGKTAFLVERLLVAHDIASAIEYLHRHGFVHKCIDSKAIGFNHNNEAKLHELGEATRVPPNGKLPGSKRDIRIGGCYTSPELEKGEAYSTKADVFSFTKLLCEILTLCKLEGDGSPRDPRAYIRECQELLSKTLPQYLLVIMKRGLSSNSNSRPSMKEVRMALEDALTNLDVSYKEPPRQRFKRRETQVKLSLPLRNGSMQFSNHGERRNCRSSFLSAREI
jgi:serine/threonine protein kinase